MTTKEIKKAVAEQIIGMIENNILNENGVESFIGWLEDGEAFFNNGMSDGDIVTAMWYASKVSDAIDIINQVLGEL